MGNESLEIPGPAGRLEALLNLPDGGPVARAVLCHAHPLHGGMMHFKPVFQAAKALEEAGVACLRFNFRGVGRSQGVHDEGRGEQDDVRAAISYLDTRFPDLPLLLGGFSFGSVMAVRVGVHEAKARALLALGFPLDLVGDTGFLESYRRPILFVQGEKDSFGSADAVRALAQKLGAAASVTVVPTSDHFFAGHLPELKQAVASWAATAPWR